MGKGSKGGGAGVGGSATGRASQAASPGAAGAAYEDFYNQSGATARSMPQAEFEAQTGRHRADLSRLNRDQLVKVSEKVGHVPGPRDSGKKIVNDLIGRAVERRGAAIRREQTAQNAAAW